MHALKLNKSYYHEIHSKTADFATSKAIYKTMDTYQLRRSIFLLGEDEVGKQLFQDAADKGKLDAIFILGMLLMAEGSERKQEALIMLNNAYIST
uniref:Uncharacterized protein n=1 Tax=Lactuca sativa TaxID=4236 RepID=A0A9R1X3D2_LACSA|nr:hypothetical protein LSAT_V11C700368380 [Lactuca sativa]